MVLLIIIPMKNGYFIGNINPTFSDKPNMKSVFVLMAVRISISSRPSKPPSPTTVILVAYDIGWSTRFMILPTTVIKSSQIPKFYQNFMKIAPRSQASQAWSQAENPSPSSSSSQSRPRRHLSSTPWHSWPQTAVMTWMTREASQSPRRHLKCLAIRGGFLGNFHIYNWNHLEGVFVKKDGMSQKYGRLIAGMVS